MQVVIRANGAWVPLTWAGGVCGPASGNYYLARPAMPSPGSTHLLLERTGFHFQHKNVDIIRFRVTLRSKWGGTSSEIQILITFGGRLMCWLEPGCWPSQSPWGRRCPELPDGGGWKEAGVGVALLKTPQSLPSVPRLKSK